MKHTLQIIIILSLFISSCKKEKDVTYSFYHWKSKAKYTETISRALTETNTKTIYMHYFDVDIVKAESYGSDGLYPKYVLGTVDDELKKYDIIPVIYITNRSIKVAKVDYLGNRISKLVGQISEKQFGKKFTKIQLDCDWTATTKEKYFKLISVLKNKYDFTISATIRLHQIKFKEKTGIPPVDEGTLMLYNVGKLGEDSQNSILESSIVRSYINKRTEYPIKLSLALPLFSQTVLKNKNNEIKLVNGIDRESLVSNKTHFYQQDSTHFEVIKDTLYKGHYLAKGYKIKLERSLEKEITESYNYIKESKINISEIIFYHLDDNALKNINLGNLIQ